MSKFLFVAFLLVSPLFGMAQLDTLDLKRLEPTYYYWDTCWVGHYVPDSTYEVIDWDCNHKIVTYRRSCSMGMTGFSKREQQLESARYFHSDSTLRIFGAMLSGIRGYCFMATLGPGNPMRRRVSQMVF